MHIRLPAERNLRTHSRFKYCCIFLLVSLHQKLCHKVLQAYTIYYVQSPTNKLLKILEIGAYNPPLLWRVKNAKNFQMMRDVPTTMDKESVGMILGKNLLIVETFVQMLVQAPKNIVLFT